MGEAWLVSTGARRPRRKTGETFSFEPERFRLEPRAESPEQDQLVPPADWSNFSADRSENSTLSSRLSTLNCMRPAEISVLLSIGLSGDAGPHGDLPDRKGAQPARDWDSESSSRPTTGANRH